MIETIFSLGYSLFGCPWNVPGFQPSTVCTMSEIDLKSSTKHMADSPQFGF